MAGATLITEAILLTRKVSGEHGLLLTFLARDHGLLQAFKRTSARSRQPAPDLFDEASLRLERPKTGGDLWFVNEYQLLQRRVGIGGNYQALLYSSRYALLLAHHLFDADEAPFWMDQLRQALDAWESGPRPEAAFFKALFLFARHQGIPVKEEWVASLSKSHQTLTRSVLRLPLTEQTAAPSAVINLIADFEHYLQHQHEIRIDGL